MMLRFLFICLLCTLVAGDCCAQLLTNNNVSLTLTNGVQVTVKGDLQNNAGTTIDNSGTIDLTGDWENNAGNNNFGSSGGTVIFNGNTQSIRGSSSTVFNNMQLAGSGVKTLQVNTAVGGAYPAPSGVLDLGTQYLALNSYTLTINNPGPAAIVRNTGFIQSETDPSTGYGILQWNIGAGTAGDVYDFPFGNIATSDYLPVSLAFTTAGTGNGSIRVSTYPTNTFLSPNNRPLPTGLPSLVNVSGIENADRVLDRWWMINTQNYTVEPVSDLLFTYRDIEWNTGNNSLSEVQLRAQRNDGITWSAQTMGNVNTTSNQVTLTDIQQYNSFWALVDNEAPLPVTLLYFDATLNKSGTVDIRWITESEINNDYFTVERSADGINFEALEIIRGAGNSTQELNYQTTDLYPMKGLSYYRLRQTDFDGNYSYSPLDRVMNNRSLQPEVLIYPNPASGFFLVALNNSLENVEDLHYTLYDCSGRKIQDSDDRQFTVLSNEALRLDLGGMAKGIYFLELILEGEKLFFGKVILK